MTILPRLESEMRAIVKQKITDALNYEDAARKSEQLANKRARKILAEAELEFRPGMKILPRNTTIQDVANDRQGKDPVWKGHAGDNRWHLDQSLASSNAALMVMKALEMGIPL